MKIEKCPLCGGEPRVIRVGCWHEFWAVQCSKCYEYMADYHEARCSPYAAILLWNRTAKKVRQQDESKSN